MTQSTAATVSPSPSSSPSTTSPALVSGTRFFSKGHWWEIDGYIKGRGRGYYRCKPACDVESRFYTEAEITQALNIPSPDSADSPHSEAHPMHAFPQNLGGRGTGRLTFEPIQGGVATLLPPKDPLKLLLVGPRHAVQRAINKLHLAGFAHLNDWSAFQKRPSSGEVLSILVQKI